MRLPWAAGHHERRQLDLGVAQVGDVAHDGVKVVAPQALTGDLAVQGGDGGRGLGLRDGDGLARCGAQLVERVLRQADFVALHDALVGGDVEGGQDMLAPGGAHLDLGQGLEALGAVGVAVAVQVGHVLAVGVDGNAAQLQRCGGRCASGRGGLRLGRCHGWSDRWGGGDIGHGQTLRGGIGKSVG